MLSLFLENSSDAANANNWYQWIFFVVIIVLLVAWLIWSTRRSKKKQQEAQDLINAVKPGNKVKTIGGVCGIVVEVDDEENTFVLETGSESSGKCYMKFDKQAIYQTDAVADSSKPEAKPEEAQPAEEIQPLETAEIADENKSSEE